MSFYQLILTKNTCFCQLLVFLFFFKYGKKMNVDNVEKCHFLLSLPKYFGESVPVKVAQKCFLNGLRIIYECMCINRYTDIVIYIIRPFKNMYLFLRKPDMTKSLKLQEINNTKKERRVSQTWNNNTKKGKIK